MDGLCHVPDARVFQSNIAVARRSKLLNLTVSG